MDPWSYVGVYGFQFMSRRGTRSYVGVYGFQFISRRLIDDSTKPTSVLFKQGRGNLA